MPDAGSTVMLRTMRTEYRFFIKKIENVYLQVEVDLLLSLK